MSTYIINIWKNEDVIQLWVSFLNTKNNSEKYFCKYCDFWHVCKNECILNSMCLWRIIYNIYNLPFKMLNVTGAPVGTHFTSSNPRI